MTFQQKGDALFYITPNGGEINISNGLTKMGWWESHINLCLCGGNMADTATPDTDHLQWMGNEDEETAYKFRSRFLSMLNGRPITSQLVRELGEAAALDIVEGSGDKVQSVICDVSIDESGKITVQSNISMADGSVVSVENEFYT